jgi:hypothetical protein
MTRKIGRKRPDILKDRLDGRFLRFASNWLNDRYSGFVVLAIDSLLTETIQQFVDGITDGHRRSKQMVTRFLEGRRFQPDFDAKAREAFYVDIRCGLLHQAEAKRMWLTRRKQVSLLQRVVHGEGYILDVERFHAAVQGSLNDYVRLISEPANSLLRSNLWAKMDQICSVRKARGALYEPEGEEAPIQSTPQQPTSSM